MLPLFSSYGSLDEVHSACQSCLGCALSASRKFVVFGHGNTQADIMLIGQGPSLTDDQTGLPYSGPAGELLGTALAQSGLDQGAVWLTNVHKCVATKVIKGRSGEQQQLQQRPPKATEVKACRHWLDEELLWIKPLVLVAIGGPAAQALIGKEFQLSEQRGQWFDGPHAVPTLATFQPTYLKRLNRWDRPAAVQGWRDLVADFQKVRERVEEMKRGQVAK